MIRKSAGSVSLLKTAIFIPIRSVRSLRALERAGAGLELETRLARADAKNEKTKDRCGNCRAAPWFFHSVFILFSR